ncbi:MAG: ribonuclease H-like domain-containing protein [bacterium]|nr:ribonuclease H-like domain-containing protein [bacterium]
MLTSTFIHIDGISYRNERHLWEHGVKTWWDVVDSKWPLPFSEEKNFLLREEVKASIREFMKDNISYFSSRLPHKEWWRFLRHYMNEIGYVDIETNMQGVITVVGLFIGKKFYYYKAGDDPLILEKMMSLPRILVSFNGTAFDIPKIRAEFPGIELPKTHFDLLKVTKSVGWHGGLKRIEESLHIKRPEHVRYMNGYNAILLWDQYKNGSEKALETLLDYNKYDVLNLEILLEMFIKEKKFQILS